MINGRVASSAPLTWQQEWGLNYWIEHWPHWVVPVALRLRGALDVGILQRSLGAILQRHTALRTRLVAANGVWKQQIDDGHEYPLQIRNIVAMPGEDAETATRRLALEFFDKPVDLTAGPLFEARLYALTEQDHVLAIRIHHLVSDAVSTMIFFRELWTFYGILIQGRPAPLSDTPVQYADYAVWQRENSVDGWQENETYWKSALAGSGAVRLPADDTGSTVQPLTSELQSIKFDRTLSCALHQFAKSQRIAPALVGLTSYAVLLSRWSGQRDFVIPFAVSGRFSSSLVEVIGYFAQFLPLRVRVRENELFVDLLRTVSREFVAASQHPDFGRVMSGSPELLEATSFNWLPGNFGSFAPTAWTRRSDCPNVESFPVAASGAKGSKWSWDVFCLLHDASDGICASVQYRSDRFAAGTMARLLADLKVLWEQLVRDPSLRVSSSQRSKLDGR